MLVDPSQSQPQQQPDPLPTSDPFAAALSSLNQNQQPTQPTTPAPIPTPAAASQPQGSSAPPKPRPILAQLIAGLIHPQAQNLAAGRPTTRTDVFEQFLGNALYAMGQGFQAAHGPGAFVKGMGAAMTAPYEQSLQQWQLGQQGQENQARIASQNAQTHLTQAQLAGLPAEQQAKLNAMTAQPRFDPNTQQYLGNMTDPQFQNYIKGQGAANQSRLGKQAQADLQAGKVAKYLPTPDGRYIALDAKGMPLHVVDGAIDPQMLQRYTTTQKPVPMGDGSIQFVPVTTTTGLAGAVTPQQQIQSKVPNLAANQTPQSQIQQKVPNLGKAAGRTVYTNQVGTAYDPQTNDYVQETAAEAAANGHQQFQKLTTKESEENRQLNNRLADVAMKLTRYEEAIKQPIPQDERNAVAQLLGEDKFKAGAFGAELPVDWMNKLGRASLQKEISPSTQRALIAYYNARESMVGYQRVLSGGSKSNEKAMELNLQALPELLSPPSLQAEALRQFKENVLIAGQGLPRQKGITSAADILSAQQQQNVPQDVQTLLNNWLGGKK